MREYVERILLNDIVNKIIYKLYEFVGIKLVKLFKVVLECYVKKREVVFVVVIFCKEKYLNECFGLICLWVNCIEKCVIELLYINGEFLFLIDRIEWILGKVIVGKLIVN